MAYDYSASYPQTEYVKTQLDGDSFWGKKQQQTSKNMLYAQLEFLKTTGRYDSFRLDKSHYLVDEQKQGIVHLFWDSDIYKYIEGACYYLRQKEDAVISSAVNEMVELIVKAQQSDGYINVHFTMCEPSRRWKNFRDHHELYTLGHLIEAAIAHQLWSNTDQLLKPTILFVKYVIKIIGSQHDQMHAYPGHPEIELALCRLYEFVQDESYLKLANYFITERGKVDEKGLIYYDYESQSRGDAVNLLPGNWPQPRSYFTQQAHLPILEQTTIEGHSVRAMYLLTGVVDACRINKDAEYLEAAKRLWSNMINNKMYVTGGIGSVDQWEGFDRLNDQLPQCLSEGGCYAETCASIGVMMLAHRFLQTEENSEYGDILDLALFNTILGSFDETGKEFTYCNMLASDDDNPCERDPTSWYACCCCPPNILRTINTIGGYLWDFKENDVVRIHSFTGMTMNSPIATITMKTDYPYSGKIDLYVDLKGDESVTLLVRIPGWAQSDYTAHGEGVQKSLSPSGYLKISNAVGKISIDLNMKPRLIFPHYSTGQNVVGVAYGPLIYCLEDVDNNFCKDHFKTTGFDVQECKLMIMPMKNGVVPIKAVNGGRRMESTEDEGPLVSRLSHWSETFDLIFVPFYHRGNRKEGNKMMRTLIRVAEGVKSPWIMVEKLEIRK